MSGGGDGSTSGNLFNAWLSQMISQNVPKDGGDGHGKEPVEPTE